MHKNTKILIVDDIPKNIQVVAKNLQNAGYDISYAQNGKRALALCDEVDFDLILLDIMMPDMDGFEVCTRLKQQPKFQDLPVIFLTAKTDSDCITRAFEVGGVDYISKPFKTAELMARVKNHLTLQEQKRQLKQLVDTKDRFFSIISHDLKSPFTGLLGFSELLLEESNKSENQEFQHYYNLIYQSARQGYNLLVNLLEWARTQTDSVPYQPEKLLLPDIIQDTVYLLESFAKEKNIKITYNAEPIPVYADNNMLKTVIRNLINNAIKFTHANGEVRIEAESNNNLTRISIVDNGMGMNKKTLKDLFRIDKKTSTKGTNKETGTGLGLIICKEFIDQHGGTINVTSEEGKGSTISFTLPHQDKSTSVT
ncbi:MAG: hybrid sensor histidine kinase/response regulator [Candidatus Delongbacteria bacterium]|jgi:two-component system sensor histidine kinase/response regulator|nr:hybrid sensor histidine kinase/response regulator [Candidatus Delongbacteria bacterium]